jgi:hypothetical protein
MPAALVQGIGLVTFPAASTIFTSGTSYGLSSSQYGAMFVPQAITAVGSSLLLIRVRAPGRVPVARIWAAASWSLPAGEPASGRP